MIKTDTIETFLKILKKKTEEDKILWMKSSSRLFDGFIVEISSLKISIGKLFNLFNSDVNFCCFIESKNHKYECSTIERKRCAFKKENRKYFVSSPIDLDKTIISSLYYTIIMYKDQQIENEMKDVIRKDK